MRRLMQKISVVACIISFFWIAGIGGGLECETISIRSALIQLALAFSCMIAFYHLAKKGA